MSITIEQVIKDSPYKLSQFTAESILSLNEKIFEKTNSKCKTEPYVKCIVRQKDIKLTPNEVVRQLYTAKLIFDYGYNPARIAYEYEVHFGREVKRADIVIRDKKNLSTPYIIVETKKAECKRRKGATEKLLQRNRNLAYSMDEQQENHTLQSQRPELF